MESLLGTKTNRNEFNEPARIITTVCSLVFASIHDTRATLFYLTIIRSLLRLAETPVFLPNAAIILLSRKMKLFPCFSRLSI